MATILAMFALGMGACDEEPGSAGGNHECREGSQSCPCAGEGLCEEGLTCSDGTCVSPGGALFGEVAPGECAVAQFSGGFTALQCGGDSLMICDPSGLCSPEPLIGLAGTACSLDSECARTVVQEGQTHELPGECAGEFGCRIDCDASGGCPLGSVCANFATTDIYTCRRWCQSDCDCPSTQRCVADLCRIDSEANLVELLNEGPPSIADVDTRCNSNCLASCAVAGGLDCAEQCCSATATDSGTGGGRDTCGGEASTGGSGGFTGGGSDFDGGVDLGGETGGSVGGATSTTGFGRDDGGSGGSTAATGFVGDGGSTGATGFVGGEGSWEEG